MALINCPECNKEISDKCTICIHCGFPISSNTIKQGTICLINGSPFDLSFFLSQSKPDAFEKFIEITDCAVYEAKKITDEIFSTGQIPKTISLETMKTVVSQPSTRQHFIPKCPTCQSTNIRKIDGVERGASIAMFGLFSKKINKTFKCNNCGYTW